MAILCPKSEAPATSQSFILNCGDVLNSTSPSFGIDGPVEELTSSWELWWTDVGPTAPDADWIDEKDPVVLGTLPGGMGSYANFPNDGRPVWLRLRCLPEGLDPNVPENWIDADTCQFMAVNNQQSQVEILNCGDTLTSTTYAVTIDSDASDTNIYDIRYSVVGPNGPFTDPLSSEQPASYPHTFQPFTSLPSDGSPIWFGLFCRATVNDPFQFVTSCQFTTATIFNQAIVCIDNSLTRQVSHGNVPQSLINSTGKPSANPNLVDWRRPSGQMLQLPFTPGNVTHTAASAAQLQSNIASVSPNNGVIQLTGNIGVFDIPASVSGINGQYRIIDLNGFTMGTGGRSYIRGNNIAIMDSSGGATSDIGSIIVVEGNNNLFINLPDTLSFEVYGPNAAAPRPTDNVFSGVCFNFGGNNNVLAGVKLSTSAGGDTANGFRTIISRCTFNNYPANAVTGVAEVDFYPRERDPSETIIYECTWFNCLQEQTTCKSDRFFIYGGLSYGSNGYHSFRSSHETALINHVFVKSRGFWLQAFGANQVIAGNIVIADNDFRALQTVTPHLWPSNSGLTGISADGLSTSIVCDNIFFSAQGAPFTGGIYIDEYVGATTAATWQANPDGPDAVNNQMFNNLYVGPSAPVYNDSTSDGRFPQTEWEQKNPLAILADQPVAIQGTNPAQATVSEPYKIGDPSAPFTNANGEKVVPNFWDSESLVIPPNTKLLDGSILNYS